ncbi:hypothetical protein RSO41_16165 [Halomonas sp. I1]|uniref:hypothetical protein n=1 Tax=Halomonas sp. I1 TaxID=393536 RepID=UPI0028DDB29C|nr:hypothetical protein [Halomonas sp. I1]MDT8896185.1 hypothetical protein [Halomonas sp. I1]
MGPAVVSVQGRLGRGAPGALRDPILGRVAFVLFDRDNAEASSMPPPVLAGALRHPPT